MLGLNDVSCIDLESFEKLAIDQLVFDKLPLKATIDIGSIVQVLSSTQMPTVVVIEAHNPETDTIGRVYLGDFGGWLLLLDQQSNTTNAMERSLCHLQSILIDLQQPTNLVVDALKYPLLALLSDILFKGQSRVLMLLDVVVDGSVRALANGLTMGECLRSLRSCPQRRHRDPNPDAITKLQDDLAQLQEDRRAANTAARQLRKQLATVESSKQHLEQDYAALQSASELERFDYEYMLASLELEAVALRDAIRDCHIKAVQAEEQACAHGLQSAELTEWNVVKQRQVDDLHGRLRQREDEFSQQVALLSEQSKTNAAALDAAQAESRRLLSDVKSAHQRIAALNDEIEEAGRLRADVQARADANSPVRRAQEREIGTLRRQLEQARQTEEKLNNMLAKSDARAEAHRQVLADLERQLQELRRGAAYANHASTNNDNQVSAALAKMEAEWKAERQAMQQLLNDFKQTAINNSTVEQPVKKKPAPPPPVIKTKTPAPRHRPQPSSEYEEPAAAPPPKPRHPTNTRKKDVPVATIMAPPAKPQIAAAIPSLTLTEQLLPTRKTAASPVKLWKPASFLPNVGKRGGEAVENAPLLANLSFGMANAAVNEGGEGRAAKRIKLPTKSESVVAAVAGQPSNNEVRPSMFRSTVSANPLAADPSLLPSIIANFNVKIPPKAK